MKINVGVITTGSSLSQETFINAHRELSTSNVVFYYGGAFNLTFQDGSLLLPKWKKAILRGSGNIVDKEYFDIEYSFKQSLKKNKVEVLVFEFGTAATILYKVAVSLKIPFIVNFYGFDINMHSVLEQNTKAYQEMFRYAFQITSVSHEMKDKLSKLGCEGSKITVNQCGPNEEFIKLEPKFNNYTFFALGRFVDKKSPIETILSFKKVLNVFPDAVLIFGGDGPLLEAAQALINGLGISKNINLIGRVTRIQYLKLMEDATAFVQHSVTAGSGDMEGTPVVILEAGLSGIPVISTLHAGIPEVVVHGETGLLVDEHDITAMSHGMLSLLKDKSLAKKLGQNARKHVLNNFSMKKHMETFDQLIVAAHSSRKSN